MIPRTCPECRSDMAGRRRDAVHCSDQCRNAAWRRDNPEKFAARQARQAQRARDRAHAARVPCPYCDSRRRPRDRTCGSTECRRLDANRQQREWFARYKEEHGEHYAVARYREQRAAYRKAHPWREANPAAARAVDDRRRARKAGADAETFTRHEVYERDGWVCQLCQHPVDRTLPYPEPGSPSLDHVVPLSKGGQHTRANTQLAHLECNLRKADTLEPPELAG